MNFLWIIFLQNWNRLVLENKWSILFLDVLRTYCAKSIEILLIQWNQQNFKKGVLYSLLDQHYTASIWISIVNDGCNVVWIGQWSVIRDDRSSSYDGSAVGCNHQGFWIWFSLRLGVSSWKRHGNSQECSKNALKQKLNVSIILLKNNKFCIKNVMILIVDANLKLNRQIKNNGTWSLSLSFFVFPIEARKRFQIPEKSWRTFFDTLEFVGQ